MPSSYTTNLGIEKIATGEQSGQWGDTTNLNFDIIDQGINGIAQTTLSAAGSSGSPNTLPITDGTLSVGRNAFIEFVDGGDLGATAYVQLTPNDAEKVVYLRNSLSASRSLIVFQGTYNASNDFEIANGEDVVLKFNGGGTGATVTDVFNKLSVTSLTTPSLTATTSTLTTLTATTGNITTGNITTGNITTLVTSGANIDGGAIDGTTVGATSASTGKFTTLNATGKTTFDAEIEEQQYSFTGTDIDPANGTIQYKTLSGNTTLTESLVDGEYVTLMIDDGTAYTITWPTTTWIGGSAPTLGTSGYNVIELWKVNGTLYGAFAGNAT